MTRGLLSGALAEVPDQRESLIQPVATKLFGQTEIAQARRSLVTRRKSKRYRSLGLLPPDAVRSHYPGLQSCAFRSRSAPIQQRSEIGESLLHVSLPVAAIERRDKVIREGRQLGALLCELHLFPFDSG